MISENCTKAVYIKSTVKTFCDSIVTLQVENGTKYEDIMKLVQHKTM